MIDYQDINQGVASAISRYWSTAAQHSPTWAILPPRLGICVFMYARYVFLSGSFIYCSLLVT